MFLKLKLLTTKEEGWVARKTRKAQGDLGLQADYGKCALLYPNQEVDFVVLRPTVEHCVNWATSSLQFSVIAHLKANQNTTTLTQPGPISTLALTQHPGLRPAQGDRVAVPFRTDKRKHSLHTQHIINSENLLAPEAVTATEADGLEMAEREIHREQVRQTAIKRES